MNILGITYGNHDTSAALFKDGRLISACEEERFNNEKHTKKFPINSVKECLKLGKLKIKKRYLHGRCTILRINLSPI